MRGTGRVYRPTWTVDGTTKRSKQWWLDYQVRGERHREPAHTTRQRVALRLLRQRVGDRESGKLTGDPEAVTLERLRGLVETDYELHGRRSKRRIVQHWAHLEAYFPKESRALSVAGTRLDDYAAHRFTEGAARQTVHHELAQLRRGFRLAVEKGLLATMPVFKLPKVENTRSGFFEDGDVAALLLELPAYLRPLIRFLRMTGWRVGEAQHLTWAQVDREAEVLRLGERETKGKDARVFPYGLAPDLKVLLDAQYAGRAGLYVFHHNGKPIRDFRAAWEYACLRAGLATRDPVTQKITVHKLVHDLRRTAAREFRRMGVSEGEIMKLCGWKTRAMFDRYNIIDEQDLARAVAKRFASGQVAAKSGVSATAA